MVSLDSINITRDVFDISFILKSDIDPKNISYAVEIKEWTEYKVSLAFNFSDPLLISQGTENDLVSLVVKNPYLFVTEDTVTPLSKERKQVILELPRQFPKDSNIETL